METVRNPQVIQIGCLQLESPFQDSYEDSYIFKQEGDGFESDESDRDIFFELYYLRPLCDFSTLLQLNTSQLYEDDRAPTSGSTSPTPGSPPTQRIRHRYIHLRHPGIESSGFFIYQSLDVLWLSYEIELESVDELRRFYGTKLDDIRSVIVEEAGLWWNLDKALRVMDLFKGIHTVYVWLESHYFEPGLAPARKANTCPRQGNLKRKTKLLFIAECGWWNTSTTTATCKGGFIRASD